jgi:Fe-S cluster assembly protein SufD
MSVANNDSTLKEWISSKNGEPTFFGENRILALEKFESLPWPSKKDEEWRRTRITKLDLDAFQLKNPGDAPEPNLGEDFSGQASWVDGRFAGVKLSPEATKAGVKVLTLEAAGNEYPDLVQKLMERDRLLWDNRFTPWLATIIQTGTVVVIPKNCILDKPLQLTVQDNRPAAYSSHQLYVLAETLAEAKVIVRIENSTPGLLFNHGVSVEVDDGAGLEILQIQNIHHESHFIEDGQGVIGRDARLRHWNGAFGAGMVKSRFKGRILGEGAEFLSKGIFFATQKQHKDIRVVQIHEAPHAHSDALHKGAVRDKGRTVFQGMIEVLEDAIGTDAYLTNKNLILNDGARADSLPMLKIDTNDVKCSHGSTTGKVDEEEVFYLKTRGIPEKDAKLLISQGLFQDVIESAPEFLWEELETLVIQSVGE